MSGDPRVIDLLEELLDSGNSPEEALHGSAAPAFFRPRLAMRFGTQKHAPPWQPIP